MFGCVFLRWHKYTKKHTANRVNSWRPIELFLCMSLDLFSCINKETVLFVASSIQGRIYSFFKSICAASVTSQNQHK